MCYMWMKCIFNLYQQIDPLELHVMRHRFFFIRRKTGAGFKWGWSELIKRCSELVCATRTSFCLFGKVNTDVVLNTPKKCVSIGSINACKHGRTENIQVNHFFLVIMLIISAETVKNRFTLLMLHKILWNNLKNITNEKPEFFISSVWTRKSNTSPASLSKVSLQTHTVKLLVGFEEWLCPLWGILSVD